MESLQLAAIQNQIDSANPILRRIISLQPAPARPQYGVSGLTEGKVLTFGVYDSSPRTKDRKQANITEI